MNVRASQPRLTGLVQEGFWEYLDETGDGTGNISGTADYSSATTDFKFVPGPNDIIRINRMLIAVVDTQPFNADLYGKDIVLTNGISVTKKNASGVVQDLTNGQPIMTNAAWGHVGFDVNNLSFGAGNQHLVVRWTFANVGQPLRVDGTKGEFFAVTLSDNFTGLIEHLFNIQGYHETRRN